MPNAKAATRQLSNDFARLTIMNTSEGVLRRNVLRVRVAPSAPQIFPRGRGTTAEHALTNDPTIMHPKWAKWAILINYRPVRARVKQKVGRNGPVVAQQLAGRAQRPARLSVIPALPPFANFCALHFLRSGQKTMWLDFNGCNGHRLAAVCGIFRNSDCSDWWGRAEDKGGNHYVGFPESTGDVTAPAGGVRPQSHLVGLVNRAGQDVSPWPHRATAPRGVWGTRGRRRRRTSRRSTVQCELELACSRS